MVAHREAGARLGQIELDPALLNAQARRAQAEAIGAIVAALGRRLAPVMRRLGRRRDRGRAVAHLRGLDDRLLNDIGLRRTDIELAVDGLLEMPRDRRPTAPSLDRHLLPGTPRMPEPANTNPTPGVAA